MQKKFITVAPDTGSGNSICNVVCDTSNPTDSSVTINITKNGVGGLSKTVVCNREEGGIMVTDVNHVGSRGMVWSPPLFALHYKYVQQSELVINGVVDVEIDQQVFDASATLTFSEAIDDIETIEGNLSFTANGTKNQLTVTCRDRFDSIHKLGIYMRNKTNNPWFILIVTIRAGLEA